MVRSRGLACVVVLVAVVGGGCGGSERVEYERDLAKVGRVVDDSLAELPADDTDTIGPDEVARIADDLREAANQLDDIDPPDDAERAQARLGEGLRGVATAFDDLAGELRTARTDSAKAELFVRFATDKQVDAAFDDLIGAQDAFAAKGYRVFGSKAPAAADAD